MSPFFFGTSERRIFGVYEPAAAGSPGKRAAVLCYPWGSEYLYAHRAIRQLAVKLSGAGYHTLRFDFFGTGDSGGESADVDLAGWESDVETAIEEIGDITGISRITLIGLRLGATIAASVAAKSSRPIDGLILWDPIVSGDEYLRQLGILPPDSGDPLDAASSDSRVSEQIQGFAPTRNVRQDFHSIDLAALISPPARRTLILLTEQLPSHERLFPIPAGQSAGSLEIESMAAIHPWLENSANTGEVPVGLFQRIVNWLG